MPEATEVRICSRIDPQTETKCLNEAADKHQWCKTCQAKYQREYQALRGGLATVRGYAKGVDALRNVLVQRFDELGSGMFSGIEIAELIQQMPAPRHDEA